MIVTVYLLYLSHIVGVYLCTPAAPLVSARASIRDDVFLYFSKIATEDPFFGFLVFMNRVGIGETAFRPTFRERTRVSQRFEC